MTFPLISILAYILEISEHGFKIRKFNAGGYAKPRKNTGSYIAPISSALHDLLLQNNLILFQWIFKANITLSLYSEGSLWCNWAYSSQVAFSQSMLGLCSFYIDIDAILLVFSQKQGHSIAAVKQILCFCSWRFSPFHLCSFSSLKGLIPCIWVSQVYTCLFFKSSFVFVKGKNVSLFVSLFLCFFVFLFFLIIFCFTMKFRLSWILFKPYYIKINL